MSDQNRLSTAKDMEVCQLLLGWDSLEKRLGGPAIIDFNLPGYTDPAADNKYASRLDVLSDIISLRKDPEIQAHPAVALKLRAQETYLRNLMGEHWDFSKYVSETIGFMPALVTEPELDDLWREVQACFAAAGLKADADLVNKLRGADQKIEEARVGDFYKEVSDRNTHVLAPIIGKIPDFNFKVKFDDVDAYWANWTDGSNKDYLLCFNKRHVKQHLTASSTILAFHEISAHMVQAAILCEKIGAGEVPKCMGLTTVHEPCSFQSEGLAQSLTYFLDTEDSCRPLLKAARALSFYSAMVDNNIHLMVNTNASIEECVAYGIKHLPYKKPEDIANSLKDKVNNPQFRCYEHVYGASFLFFKKFAQQANVEQKQTFLKRVYNEWLSADELKAFAQELLKPKDMKNIKKNQPSGPK